MPRREEPTPNDIEKVSELLDKQIAAYERKIENFDSLEDIEIQIDHVLTLTALIKLAEKIQQGEMAAIKLVIDKKFPNLKPEAKKGTLEYKVLELEILDKTEIHDKVRMIHDSLGIQDMNKITPEELSNYRIEKEVNSKD